MTDLKQFTVACIEALYFTDTGDTDQPPSDAGLDPETKANLSADCRSFWHRFSICVKISKMTPEQAGHDFWLTRNGHGAGFWDGDWPEPWAKILTDGSTAYGAFDTYQGDTDGLLYGVGEPAF